MGAVSVGVIVVVALGAAVACGGDTTGSTGSGGPGSRGGTSSGGTSDAGAAECKTASDCDYPLICIQCSDGVDSCPTGATCENGVCSTTYSHECSPGAGGASAGGAPGGGGTGGVSPGTATIEFSVGPGSYCSQQCAGGGTIAITDLAGQPLPSGNLCQTDCSTCKATLCPQLICSPDAVVTGARLDWDGHYYASVRNRCGDGSTCLEQQVATPGKYIATYCATPGTMSGVDGGASTCTPTGPEKCRSVQFEFPSGTIVNSALCCPP